MLARIISLLVVLIGLCGWFSPAVAVEASQSFVAPVIKDFRLDWCRNWGAACGGPAADLFCKEKGFDKATRWSIEPNVGARGIPTLVFGDGRLCKAPNCSGFRVIVCARVAAVPAKPTIKVLPGALKVKEKPSAVDKKITVKPPPAAPPKIIKKAVKADVRRKVATFKFTKLSTFKPRKPAAVRLTWINTLRVLKTYPGGTTLYKCESGDCSIATSHDREIDEKAPTVDLAFTASTIPHAEAGLWQVSYLPFPAFANAGAKDVKPARPRPVGADRLSTGLVLVQCGGGRQEIAGGRQGCDFPCSRIPCGRQRIDCWPALKCDAPLLRQKTSTAGAGQDLRHGGGAGQRA